MTGALVSSKKSVRTLRENRMGSPFRAEGFLRKGNDTQIEEDLKMPVGKA